MTYNVFSGTLNLAQSIDRRLRIAIAYLDQFYSLTEKIRSIARFLRDSWASCWLSSSSVTYVYIVLFGLGYRWKFPKWTLPPLIPKSTEIVRLAADLSSNCYEVIYSGAPEECFVAILRRAFAVPDCVQLSKQCNNGNLPIHAGQFTDSFPNRLCLRYYLLSDKKVSYRRDSARRRSLRPSVVQDHWYHSKKSLCDFLSVNNTNLHPISHHVPVTAQ